MIYKLSQSSICDKIYCAPGNAGISELAECIDIKANEIQKLCDFAKANRIGLTVVGPEDPLVMGITDLFEEEGLKIFGPSKELSLIHIFRNGFRHAKQTLSVFHRRPAKFLYNQSHRIKPPTFPNGNPCRTLLWLLYDIVSTLVPSLSIESSSIFHPSSCNSPKSPPPRRTRCV